MRLLLEAEPDRSLLRLDNRATLRGDLQALYALHADSMLWSDGRRPSAQALALLERFTHADDDGLAPADYAAELLAARLAQLQSDQTSTPRQWADWDFDVATAAMRFVRHLHFGRIDPFQVGYKLKLSRAAIDVPALVLQLAGAVDVDALLSSIEPQFLHYRLLKQQLRRYRTLVPATDAMLPAFNTRSIGQGDSYSGIALLRQRLSLLGELNATDTAGADDDRLTPELSDALRSFQRDHGLNEDGVLGKGTLRALNLPTAFRIRQIELSMERWRWLPEIKAATIVVNIPQFRLFAFDSNEDREENLLTMAVVVGQSFPARQTPVFVGDLKFVVFRPYWDVPSSIARAEILPALARDPHYLERQHMELVRGSGDDATVVPASSTNLHLLGNGQTRLRQRPGPDNALGDIKFLFPNPYNVYLHSTPARKLFALSRRAFSHGCIRVEDPAALAGYVLRNEPEPWSPAAIAAAMSGLPNQRVVLAHSIPVMILYATAVATESGRLYLLDDLYGLDRELEQRLGLTAIAGSTE